MILQNYYKNQYLILFCRNQRADGTHSSRRCKITTIIPPVPYPKNGIDNPFHRSAVLSRSAQFLAAPPPAKLPIISNSQFPCSPTTPIHPLKPYRPPSDTAPPPGNSSQNKKKQENFIQIEKTCSKICTNQKKHLPLQRKTKTVP